MMELKTLKDMVILIRRNKTDGLNRSYVSYDELKQEAIKWVKERSENCQQCNYYGWLCEEHEFWKKRFNITEEDLE